MGAGCVKHDYRASRAAAAAAYWLELPKQIGPRGYRDTWHLGDYTQVRKDLIALDALVRSVLPSRDDRKAIYRSVAAL